MSQGRKVTMAEQTVFTEMNSPLGDILLAGTAQGLTHITFQEGNSPIEPEPDWQLDASAWATAVAQLTSYFAGELQTFDLPLAPAGTPFQQEVWRFLQTIPYGRTTTYGAIAHALGKPTASRAVGAANGRNPLPIIIPCHRVIGSNGKLTGYAGGLKFKEALMALERNGRIDTAQQLSILF
jgi:methylated-DNA-[protein]-cysteine S-methyltransferase